MRVVLSHPFSGAIYWWFAQYMDVSAGMRSKQPTHGYYSQLYGDIDRNCDTALASAVVFEEIVLPAADAAFPRHGIGVGENMRVPELDLEADWGHVREAGDLARENGDGLLADETVREILSRLPAGNHRMELEYAITDVVMTRGRRHGDRPLG
jgi:hypothetical protein